MAAGNSKKDDNKELPFSPNTIVKSIKDIPVWLIVPLIAGKIIIYTLIFK
ncbi:MAG: hypothetical protein ACYDDA_05885 [Acidiferrobacteraceae bacterium]